jgi:hypothetical protein
MRVIWFIVELNRINYSLRTSFDVTVPENNVTFMRFYRWYLENILVVHFIWSCKSYVTKFVWQGRCHLCNFEYRICSNAVYNAVIAYKEISFAIVKCVRFSSQEIFLWPMERYIIRKLAIISEYFRIDYDSFVLNQEPFAERVRKVSPNAFWNAFWNASGTLSITRSERVLQRVQKAFWSAFRTRFSLAYFWTVLYQKVRNSFKYMLTIFI